MPTVDYANVQPLIAAEQVEDRQLHFVFQCTVSGFQINASHAVSQGADPKTQIAGKAKRAAFFALRGPISSAIRRAFGTSTIGRLIGDVGSTAAYVAATPSSQGSNLNLSKQQRQDAAVAAFRSVASSFSWDDSRGGWVSCELAKDLSSEFQRQLSQHSVEHPYDQTIAARMLVEIAQADGVIEAKEQEYLGLFLPPSAGSLTQLQERPALSAAELAEAQPGPARLTLLSLAWVLALADESFDPAEAALLEHFRSGLEDKSTPLDKARELAQDFLVDQLLEQSAGEGDNGRGALGAFADRLGIDAAEIQRAEARFHKRRALANA